MRAGHESLSMRPVARGAGVFFHDAHEVTVMKSVRKGLREGAITKDTYERLTCAECGKTLKSRNEPEEVFTVRTCPECGREWKEIG